MSHVFLYHPHITTTFSLNSAVPWPYYCIYEGIKVEVQPVFWYKKKFENIKQEKSLTVRYRLDVSVDEPHHTKYRMIFHLR